MKLRKILWREFTRNYSRQIEMKVLFANYESDTKVLSPVEYDRYVNLANSGRFTTEILDSDYGVGWTLFSPRAGVTQ